MRESHQQILWLNKSIICEKENRLRDSRNKQSLAEVKVFMGKLRVAKMDTDFSPRSPNKKSEEILLSTKHPPMMTSLIPLIRKQIDFCNLLAIIPFEWDVAKGRLRLLESPVKLMACKIQIGIHVAYTTLIFAYFLSPQNLSSIPNSTRMMGQVMHIYIQFNIVRISKFCNFLHQFDRLTFLVCFGATMLMRLTIWNMKTDVVHLFNNYLFFEETYLPGK